MLGFFHVALFGIKILCRRFPRNFGAGLTAPL
jgi:hypothetical protein